MATIDDKLTADVVPLNPFTYDQASAALQAHPRQKNISALARRWGVPRSTARRWLARYKDDTGAARSVASSAASGAQTGRQGGAPAPHLVPQPVPQSSPSPTSRSSVTTTDIRKDHASPASCWPRQR
jgi:transposase-like protein